MANGTHAVVVWIGTRPGEEKLFTITARNADGNIARMIEVEEQVAAAGFVEDYREEGLTKAQADKRKREVIAEYKGCHYALQSRNELPNPMKQ
jgi:hypothetical protein